MNTIFQRLLASSAVLMLLLFSGCELTEHLNQLTKIDYNNEVVEHINLTSASIEQSATLYNDNIPTVVTEADDIDVSLLETSYDEMTTHLDDAYKLSDLQSRDLDQEQDVEAALSIYLETAEIYASSYSGMLNYYKTQEYKENITLVDDYDEKLHIHYTLFIDANNHLVEVLNEHVDFGLEYDSTD